MGLAIFVLKNDFHFSAVIHRVFNDELGFVRDLVEDGRHRAYAHHLSGRETAKAFVQRIPVDKHYLDSVKLTPLKDFGVKEYDFQKIPG